MSLRFLTLLLCLYLAALIPRTVGVLSAEPDVDELLWQRRAYLVKSLIHSDGFYAATHHLGHPGLTPALLMAGGQVLAEKYNKANSFSPESDNYITRLQASRLALVFVTSLVAPVVFLGLYAILGTAGAAIISLLFALDPTLVGLSRLAHLDATLTVTVITSLFFFLASEKKNSVLLSLCAGIFWGLSFITKPTAGALVLIFLAIRFLSQLYLDNKIKIKELVKGRDILAVSLAHIIFGMLYARLWVHPSRYLKHLKVESEFADLVYHVGSSLADFRIPLLILIPLFIAFVCWKLKDKFSKQNIVCLGLAVAFLGEFWIYAPQVIENIIRFWLWVAGLSTETHDAFGYRWEDTGGYIKMFFTKVPSIIIIGSVLGLLVTISRLFKGEEREKVFLSLVMLLLLVLWVAPLTTSTKQAFRYAAPSLIGIYTLAGIGYLAVVRIKGLVLLALVFVIINFLQFPHYRLFYNSLTGGLARVVQEKELFPAVGQKAAVDFLTKQISIPTTVTVYGSEKVFSHVLRLKKRLSPEPISDITFVSEGSDKDTDYVVLTGVFNSYRGELFGGRGKKAELVYSYDVEGTSVLSIYKIPYQDFNSGGNLSLRFVKQATGSLSLSDSARFPVLHQAIPGRHKKGFVVHGVNTRVTSGDYLGRFYLAIPFDFEIGEEFTVDRYVARIDFGSHCTRVITLGELKRGEFLPFEVGCSYTADAVARFSLYWFGNLPVEFGRLEIEGKKE